jgi:DNA polymerase-4
VGHDPFGGVRALAQDIRNNVRAATGLTCSVGVTPNKLLSKIASELDKPDGLTVLTHDDLPRRIWPLPVRRINGIGPKSAAKLAALKIATIADLAAADRKLLAEHFGKAYARWLHEAAHGRDERALSTSSEPVSISRETTFDRDLSADADRAELGAILDELVEHLAHDLQRKGYVGKTVGIKLRFDDFKTVTRDLTLPDATAEPEAIRRAAGLCLKRVDLTRRLRLMGVRMGTLQHAGR